MTVVRPAAHRITETPNGIMTTLASPTQGGTDGRSVWRAEVRPGLGAQVHAIDAEQIWTFLTGGATVELGAETFEAGPGDVVVFPADRPRRVTALADGFTVLCTGPAAARAYNPGGLTPDDACGLHPRDAERISPPWMR